MAEGVVAFDLTSVKAAVEKALSGAEGRPDGKV